jgi:hypothetical protein
MLQKVCVIYIDYDDVKKEDIYEDKEDFLWLNGNEKEKKTEWDTSPYEWFAEDFRYFFGVDKTKFWHMPISLPDDKIKEFILSLK